MASDIGSEKNEEADLVLAWSGRWTLAHRILAVNVLILVVFALSRPLPRRLSQPAAGRAHPASSQREAQLTAGALSAVSDGRARGLARRLSAAGNSRAAPLRCRRRAAELDSWRSTGPTYGLRDPATREMDARTSPGRSTAASMPWSASDQLDDFVEPAVDRADAWPEAARRQGRAASPTEVRQAPDLTPVFSAGAPLADGDSTAAVPSTTAISPAPCARQRGSLAIAMAHRRPVARLLSLFLARTIVRPLRRIALAAHRVRLGRAREVKVPRLPSRRDEIGMLARAVSAT